MTEKWRIVLAEQNMDLGSVDRAVFGKDACHSFLALVNHQNDVISGRQNCNAVTRSMLHAMDIDLSHDDFDLMPHGYKNKLWEKSLVGEFNTRGAYSVETIEAYLAHVQNSITRDMPKIVNDELDMRSSDLKRSPVIKAQISHP
tara:strand:+ start:91420 stop:91851 length:432 start_codon:yes stop_codon:yes gene_type:complete